LAPFLTTIDRVKVISQADLHGAPELSLFKKKKMDSTISNLTVPHY